MALLPPSTRLKFFDTDGNPLAGGRLFTYEGGTLTPKPTYTDHGGSTMNENPIILDSRGEANVWLGAGKYKFVIATTTGDTVQVVDGIVGVPECADDIYYRHGSIGSITTTIGDKLRQFISAADFGMHVAATSVANKNALIAALAASDSVFIPAGTYRIDGPIDVAGKRIAGAGMHCTVLQVPGLNTQTTLFFNNKTSDAPWGTGGHLELRDLTLNGNWDGRTDLANQAWDSTAALLKLGAAAGVRLVDVSLRYSYGHNASFYRLGYATFTRVKVAAARKNGLHFEAPSGNDAITSTWNVG
jgi:hypothetical protein